MRTRTTQSYSSSRLFPAIACLAATVGLSSAALAEPPLPQMGGYVSRVYCHGPYGSAWGIAFDKFGAGFVASGCLDSQDSCYVNMAILNPCTPEAPVSPFIADLPSDIYNHVLAVDRTGKLGGTPGRSILISNLYDQGAGGIAYALTLYTPPSTLTTLFSGDAVAFGAISGMAVNPDGDLVLAFGTGTSGRLMKYTGTLPLIYMRFITEQPGQVAIDPADGTMYVSCADGKVHGFPADENKPELPRSIHTYAPNSSILWYHHPGESEGHVGVVDTNTGDMEVPVSGGPFFIPLGSGFNATYGQFVQGAGECLFLVDTLNDRIIEFAPEEGFDPLIDLQPVPTHNCVNGHVGFTTHAIPRPSHNLIYTWYFRKNAVTPPTKVGTGPSLTVTVKGSTVGTYFAVITDCDGGQAVTNEAALISDPCIGWPPYPPNGISNDSKLEHYLPR